MYFEYINRDGQQDRLLITQEDEQSVKDVSDYLVAMGSVKMSSGTPMIRVKSGKIPTSEGCLVGSPPVRTPKKHHQYRYPSGLQAQKEIVMSIEEDVEDVEEDMEDVEEDVEDVLEIAARMKWILSNL